jgi:hypothetical protein
VDRSGLVVACRKRGANAGIHSSAKEDDCATRFVVGVHSLSGRRYTEIARFIIL